MNHLIKVNAPDLKTGFTESYSFIVKMGVTIMDHEKKAQDEYQALFQNYLEVCNKAIDQHKDHFPYKEIWNAGLALLGDKNTFDCAVYDNRPQGLFRMRFGKDKKVSLVKDAHPDPKKCWTLKYTYLKHVAEHPDEYIKNPAKLDWDWLKSRITE